MLAMKLNIVNKAIGMVILSTILMPLKNNLNNIIPIIPKININFVSIITSTNAIIFKRAINLLTYII